MSSDCRSTHAEMPRGVGAVGGWESRVSSSIPIRSNCPLSAFLSRDLAGVVDHQLEGLDDLHEGALALLDLAGKAFHGAEAAGGDAGAFGALGSVLDGGDLGADGLRQVLVDVLVRAELERLVDVRHVAV